MILLHLLVLFSTLVHAFDVSLSWDVPDTAQDVVQASARIQLNSTSSPLGTEWVGVGWDTGAISLQKLSNDQLIVLLQLRAPNNSSSIRVGRVTEYASAHIIDQEDHKKQGMYLQSKIDKDDSGNQAFTLKVIAHYNMIANNTIYQGLWSDGEVWTYMGSLVLQHPKVGSIKEEVARALEDAARLDDPPVSAKMRDASEENLFGSKNQSASATPTKDPLGGAKAPETLATCEINRDSSGRIRPVCKFIRQLPVVPSFAQPFSAVRRTVDGNPKFERAGVFKDLMLKGRLANVYDITAGRCVSHNRGGSDVASCQRDPNNPEFYISIDGLTPAAAKERAEMLGEVAVDSDVIAEQSSVHGESTGLSTALYVAGDPVGEIRKRTGALLSRNDLSTTCEVVMINNKFGIAAASCLIYTSPGVIDPSVKYTVVYNQGEGHAYAMMNVEKILPHPNYNPDNFANNLAILSLPAENPAPFSNPVADWPSEWETLYLVQRAGAPTKTPTWGNPQVVSALSSTTDRESCKSNSFIYGLNPHDFICSPLSLSTNDANCVMPYGVVYQYDGTQAVVAALLSHSTSQGSTVFCSGVPVYSYYTIINNYILWIQTAVGTGVEAYHSANAVGYVPSSDPLYQMKQVEEVVSVAISKTEGEIVEGVVAGNALSPALGYISPDIIINNGKPVPPITETITTTETVSMPTTITTTATALTTTTTTATTTTTTTTTASTVSLTTVTQTQVSVITVAGAGPNGNQSVGVDVGINISTVTVTSTATSTSTITVTVPPSVAGQEPVAPPAPTANVPAPVTVTVTAMVSLAVSMPATITTTTTVVSVVAGAAGVTIIPITQWMPITETATSTATSFVTSLFPITVAGNPEPTESATSTLPTSLPTKEDEKPIDTTAIIAIVLLSLLAIAVIAYLIRRKRKQNRIYQDTDASRVQRWLFFGRHQNRESYRPPSRMSELARPSYR
ncbi:hypothetical protein IWW39_004386 [Coemansia spiralis]|uniref:Peptidase S1 domain-containing protein n=1 Tax=Coemansia spiralis TaxID=417178 RepID=A0A9W8GJ78_9FUNG|nr:hypothetical protein IWW39_004386 [Coemansia spiralis]